ncbi:MAG: hypothetical protein A2096_02440 [Spirochaetes bacterium GWF1_41_5]|nr:MAG: hypothetical protein A2096_02440 [Spirochaetes bacterium GWF1_41_5]HBE03026.1 hypothetical protein [Spirochaetia bacterium]
MLNKFLLFISISILCASFTCGQELYENISETLFGKEIKGLDNRSGLGLSYGLANNPYYRSEQGIYFMNYALSFRRITSILYYYPAIKGVFFDIESSLCRNSETMYVNIASFDIGVSFNLRAGTGTSPFHPYVCLGLGCRGPLDTTGSPGILQLFGYKLTETYAANPDIFLPDFFYRFRGGVELYLSENRFSISAGVFLFPQELHRLSMPDKKLLFTAGGEIGIHIFPFSR